MLINKSQRSLVLLALLLLAVPLGLTPCFAGDLEPPASPAPTMKTLTEVEPRVAVQSLPGDGSALHVISEAGSYYLTDDILGVSGKSGIYIGCNDVSIDLGGFTLIGVSGSESGIATLADVENVNISNGAARDWGSAGFLIHAKPGTLHGLKAYHNGGIGITIWEGLISDCYAKNNGGEGIRLDGKGLIRNSTAADNYTGFKIVGSGTATGCTAVGNQSSGIEIVFGGQVSDSHFEGNGIGILLESNGQASGNSVIANTTGIEVKDTGARCQITNNMLAENNTGILVPPTDSLVIRNCVTASSVADFDIGPGNAYGPIVDVSGAGDISGTTGADHPWANFVY